MKLTVVTRLVEAVVMKFTFVHANYVGQVFCVWVDDILAFYAIVLVIVKVRCWI